MRLLSRLMVLPLRGQIVLLESAFDYSFVVLPTFMVALRVCVTAVDVVVLCHGMIVTAYSTRSYLCGPKVKFCFKRDV
jgi:hypothetical protein